MTNNIKLKKGEKKRLARKLREVIHIPARKICKTMKNSTIIDKIQNLINKS